MITLVFSPKSSTPIVQLLPSPNMSRSAPTALPHTDSKLGWSIKTLVNGTPTCRMQTTRSRNGSLFSNGKVGLFPSVWLKLSFRREMGKSRARVCRLCSGPSIYKDEEPRKRLAALGGELWHENGQAGNQGKLQILEWAYLYCISFDSERQKLVYLMENWTLY